MGSTDFELVLACVAERPGLTGREISTVLKRQGHTRFTSKLVNQTLYRLLTADLVSRDSSGEKPKWSPGNLGATKSSPDANLPKRPFARTDQQVRTFRIANTDVRVLLDEEMSPNDPYISPDWVGSHVIVSVNARHPFWAIRIESPGDQALYSMIVAIDGYVMWKVAQLNEPPDATEVQKLRDYALRFCVLEDTETPTSD